jgi:hypothetical protein
MLKKIGKTFDHAQILAEYLSFQEGNILPDKYKVDTIFNNGYTELAINTCPYTVSICEELKKDCKFNFVVFRLVASRTTFLFHTDDDVAVPVYHIPVTTNEGCFFIFNNHLFPMQELGQLYAVNPREYHNFINGGLTPRLHVHFVYDLEGKYQNNAYTIDGKGHARL